MGKLNIPKTRLEDLFEYHKEIKAQENHSRARINAGFNEEQEYQMLLLKSREIREKYKSTMHQEDCYKFSSLESARTFLNNLGLFPENYVEKRIAHEEDHAKAILNEGLEVSGYCCWLVLDPKDSIDFLMTTTTKVNSIIKREVIHRISLSPKDPSYFDLYH